MYMYVTVIGWDPHPKCKMNLQNEFDYSMQSRLENPERQQGSDKTHILNLGVQRGTS